LSYFAFHLNAYVGNDLAAQGERVAFLIVQEKFFLGGEGASDTQIEGHAPYDEGPRLAFGHAGRVPAHPAERLLQRNEHPVHRAGLVTLGRGYFRGLRG
jgi:hypothetical protein